MAHKVGDTVTVTRGPHKGAPHKVIHVHKDGSVNVKPHKMMPHQIKYRLGAAKAKSSEVRKMNKEGTIITPKNFKMKDDDKNKLKKVADLMKKAKDTKEACWDTHKQVGMKKKGGKMVPNCVPKNENQNAALMKKLAKSAQSSEKGKKAVTLKKAPFRIPSKDDMKNEACWDTHKQVGMKKKGGKMVPNCVPKNEGAMKRIATSQSSKPDRMAGKGLDTFKKKPPEKNEVLDKDKDHMSYRQKAKYSMDRARNSATAKIVRGKGDDIDKEKNTLRKRAAGMAMSDRKGVRQFRKFHGYDKKK